MAAPAFKEAIELLGKIPALWIPGLVAGLLGAGLSLVLFTSGTFFAGRLIIIFGLVLVLFIAGMLGIIRSGEGNAIALVREGIRHYFRVLLPFVVIIFIATLAIVFLMMNSAILVGGSPDISILFLIFLFISIPVLFFTGFFDAAAVLEDQKVFDSIRRSISIVVANAGSVIRFFIVCAACCFVVVFTLMIIWEAILYDSLQPITKFNETQMASFTPDQFIAMIGQNGMWITAIMIFVGLFILVPLITTYKACFFRHLVKSPANIQQLTGEYDSKGRWYKY